MKIIRITDGYTYPSTVGPNVFVHLLSTELAKRGHQCIIYNTITGNEEIVNGKINGYIVKNYKPLFRVWSFPISPKLIANILSETVDVIHVHGYRSFHSELAAWLRTFKKIPYILSPHGCLLAYKYFPASKLYKSLHRLYDTATLKFALRKADSIAVTSDQEAKEALQLGVSQNKIRVMHHAEKVSTMTTPLCSPQRTHRVLAVGRIDSQQNLHTLIKAFAVVLEQVRDAKLVIVGPSSFGRTYVKVHEDYQQNLFRLCYKLGIKNNVIFTGPLFGDDLNNAYATSDVYVYTGPYGNYGRVHIEAAAFGKPIISTPVGIVPDLVGNDDGGFLVNPYDIEGIARAIVTLLSDTKVYQAKQKAIVRRVKRFLDVRRMVDEYEELYKQVSSH